MNWSLTPIMGIALLFLFAGCEGRAVDMSEQSHKGTRENREGAPPTGLKENPGRPQSYRPETP